MYKVFALISILFFTAAVAAQDKFDTDKTLIDNYLADKPAKTKAKPIEYKSEKAPLSVRAGKYAYQPGESILPESKPNGNPNAYDEALTNIERDVVVYPSDWPEKVKKREKHKDGVIARGEPDKDGKYIVIYDVSDLIYEPPNFVSRYGTPADNLRRAYRDHYEHQRRYYHGLFQDEPIKQDEPVGPVYSRERADNLAELIRSFLRDDGEVEVLVPHKK